MTSYKLEFHLSALKEWGKLDASIKEQFKKQLEKRLVSPHIPSARLSNELAGCYKIKLRTSGYRLVYTVHESNITVIVIVVGKRNKGEAYAIATKRVIQLFNKII